MMLQKEQKASEAEGKTFIFISFFLCWNDVAASDWHQNQHDSKIRK